MQKENSINAIETSVVEKAKRKVLMFPVISEGAEVLVQGNLMRRNILTYKAPPNNEGYDLICIHPNPRISSKQIRVQVKSRYQTDSNRAFFVKEVSFDAFDYLVVVFMNIGYFYTKKDTLEGRKEVEYYTLPVEFIRKYHNKNSKLEKVSLKGLDIEKYKDEKGFEQIAQSLCVNYPSREVSSKDL